MIDYIPMQNTSSAWRGICKVKEKLNAGFRGIWWEKAGCPYSISAGYKWLMPVLPKVSWEMFVWNKCGVPKHSFITWVMMLRRLPTVDRLVKWGVCTDASCFLCQAADENHDHLFFRCIYGRKCIAELSKRSGINIPCADVAEW